MRKIILIFMLAIASGSANAEWVYFGTAVVRDDVVMAYVNQSTIHKNGKRVTMWILYDAKTPRKFENSTYLSSMGQDEYDCVTAQSRNLAVLLYSENLGHGSVVSKSSAPSSDWDPALPDSMAGHLLKYACGKK
ncbi:hypothetical protein GALL_190480 [mine drainage metagenome]|uniref:Surface-adhesin protein E-like domain-containing protein n=1 Tax=mine drainage metagenome TaxID=410659 RepID=A0A1J5RTD8_9ZZZZ